ncbi:PREDICTED: uncharacterized protein LOC108759403, partial [Trachymyrmex cornetzi]|uniref:uncharacterized protein LOC108759403 n=1 Tax=Trachymyrmex cornetzi TaxID=471704 RepID=UPI00084F7A23
GINSKHGKDSDQDEFIEVEDSNEEFNTNNVPKASGSAQTAEEDDENQTRLTVRIPPFWPKEPEIWFMQLEGQFALCKVTDDNAKFAYAHSRIEPKLTDSQNQRIRQLLEREELGDRKPSQFLRHRTLAGTAVSKELLRTLWLGRLPSQMQAILATRSEDRLEDIAEQADRIHEVNNSKALVLATSVPSAESTQNALEEKILTLTKQVAALSTQMTKVLRSNRSRSHRSRSRFKQEKSDQKGICYYHRRFKEEARKCTQPCSFKTTKNSEGSH